MDKTVIVQSPTDIHLKNLPFCKCFGELLMVLLNCSVRSEAPAADLRQPQASAAISCFLLKFENLKWNITLK